MTGDAFQFTAKNAEAAKAVIARYPEGRQQSAVMPLLDLAQYKLDTVPAVLSANKHFAQLRLLPLGRRENRLILAT